MQVAGDAQPLRAFRAGLRAHACAFATATPALAHDAQGSLPGVAIVFATQSSRPAITAADFTVV